MGRVRKKERERERKREKEVERKRERKREREKKAFESLKSYLTNKSQSSLHLTKPGRLFET